MKHTPEFYDMKIVEGIAPNGEPGFRLEPWPSKPTLQDFRNQDRLLDMLAAGVLQAVDTMQTEN